jgi:RNA polymerase sigma-70 factor (ECF subfamily)
VPDAGPEHPDDAARELTRAVSRGDRAALERFYTARFDGVYAAARRVTGRDEAFCLDVVQEVMLKVARKMRPMRTAEELERWIWRVVRTTSADLLKMDRRRAARESRRRVPSPPPRPDAAALAAEAAERIALGLSRLPEAEAALVVQRAARERTLADLAADTGTTPGAVHGRVRRAVAKLAKATGAQEP